MKCPKCRSKMLRVDEEGNPVPDDVVPFVYWQCSKCDYATDLEENLIDEEKVKEGAK